MRPLRLVEFTRAFYLGGTERQVLELLRGLPGHYDVRVGALELEGPLVEELRALGHTAELFPLAGSFAQLNTGRQVARMAAWLRRNAVELVHVHDFYATLVAVPAAKLAGCKVVVSRLDLAHWHNGPRRALWSALTHWADHVVVNADAIREMLQRDEGLSRQKITVVKNGLDLGRFDRQRLAPLKAAIPDVGEAPVVLHVANMNSEVKRQEDLLQALRALKSTGVPLHAFLVGDGPRRPSLEALAKALGVADRAHFLGHRQDVPALHARATMGVLCSSAEGLSNAIMEGMAAQLPMVVTRAGGNAELVMDGERGLVVTPFRPKELAEAFRTLLDNPLLRRTLGGNARLHVERTLDVSRMVEGHDQVYRRVAASA